MGQVSTTELEGASSTSVRGDEGEGAGVDKGGFGRATEDPLGAINNALVQSERESGRI